MAKKLNIKVKYLVFLVLAVIVGSFFIYKNLTDNPVREIDELIAPTQPQHVPGTDPLNASYIIEGDIIPLKNGTYEQRSLDGKTPVKYTVYEDIVEGDLQEESKLDQKDSVLILIQDTGELGIYYYLVASLETEKGFVGTNGVLLGQDIKPVEINVENGIIAVEFLDRSEEDAIDVEPSIVKSLSIILEDGKLIELAED